MQFIKNCLSDADYNRNVSARPDIIRIISLMLSDFHKHYELSDIEKQGYHEQRFFLLYMDKNALSFEEMAEKTYIGIVGFKRWVRFYNKTALNFITKKSVSDINYAFIADEYKKSGI